MIIRCHSSSMISVFPESTFTTLSAIVFLRDASGGQLHTGREFLFTTVSNQQVDVVRGNCVVQYRQTISTPCLIKPVDPASPIPGKLEKKLPLVTTVRDMPDVTWQNVPVCSCHIPLPCYCSLQFISFSYQKLASKAHMNQTIQVLSF